MSGTNTKAQKIDRILIRQRELDVLLTNIAALMRLNRETDTETIAMLTAVVKSQEEQLNRQEGQLDRLRKYLGSELFKRRQREMQIPTLSHTHHGMNAPRGLPHATKETV